MRRVAEFVLPGWKKKRKIKERETDNYIAMCFDTDWRQRSSLIIASDIFTATLRRNSPDYPCFRVVPRYTHLSHARTHASTRSVRGEIDRVYTSLCFTSNLIRTLTYRVDGPPPPSSSSTSSLSLPRGDEGGGMARSETRLGETTPRLINPPSVEVDEADEGSERRQRDNAHSITGRTYKSSYTLGCWALVIRTHYIHSIHRETRSAPENRG